MPPRRRKQAGSSQQQQLDIDTAQVADPVGAVPVVESATREGAHDGASDNEKIKQRTSSKSPDRKKNAGTHRRRQTVRKPINQSRRFVFFLGAFLGIFLAWYFAAKDATFDVLQELNLDALSEFVDEIKDNFPIGLLKEAEDISKQEQQRLKQEAFAIGRHMREEGIRAKYPVVMVPGVISTGLESWSVVDTTECGCEQYFRKRLWGSFNMLRAMFLDKTCWLKHIMLDPHTGLDPEGYKLRAAQGLDAADFFMAGYWIWNKILENLAVIAYDPNTMHSAAYDWRLSYIDLERRDGYFSKLKVLIEEHKRLRGQKTVLVSHSMGSQVVFFFFKWVEAAGPEFGNGGNTWVNDYVEAFVDISGSTLGTPKSIVALLSGEMRDTVQLNALAVYGLEKFFSRAERALLLRTFTGIASMLPKGGDAVWGALTHAPDDDPAQNRSTSYGNFLQFQTVLSDMSSKNLTVAESIEFLYSQAPHWFRDRIKENYSFGLAKTRQELVANENDYRKWVNPLEVALPNAPDLKIFCFYGIGKPTERAYVYQEEKDKSNVKLNVTISSYSSQNPEPVIMGEGDGTVSLLTHAMCHKWKEQGSKFNPGNSKVVIVEMPHEPERFDVRGGPKTADHVDVLGRAELNELVLKVASGNGHEIQDRLVSKLAEYAAKIDLGEN
ncbi:Lecithin:cholesterol acyltransferase-domain-containing protein [Lipomyces japonicus]|uniref:Lecithin:cholesterol acyltransferase-domain-containing protein n=1 Tax=Lipomyces japonicus TaxID=56871 RepID=UPI0034CF7C21